MKLIQTEKLKMILADEGKKIRSASDEYREAYLDENGDEIPENVPYYTNKIYVPNSFTEHQMYELYIEEVI